MKYILASKSPRRRELLAQAGYTFAIEPAVGEEVKVGSSTDEIVINLARQKAEKVYHKHEGELVLVIGADTIVVYEGEILGKPADRADAKRMLSMLSGKTHQVFTGVCLIGEQIKTFYERTDVTFYDLTDDEIEKYVMSGDCDDKAGAYGIQGAFAIHVRRIDGDYNNVVGLPIARLYQEMKGFR